MLYLIQSFFQFLVFHNITLWSKSNLEENLIILPYKFVKSIVQILVIGKLNIVLGFNFALSLYVCHYEISQFVDGIDELL